MKSINNVLASLVLVLGITSLGGVAHGQQPFLRPQLVPPTQPVKLGIRGHFDFAEGMHVEQVMRHSIASRMGLEAGDVIVSINGRRLRTENDYFRQLSNSGSWLRVGVLDVRSGRVIERSARLQNQWDDDRWHDHDHNHGHRFPIEG